MPEDMWLVLAPRQSKCLSYYPNISLEKQTDIFTVSKLLPSQL